MVNPAPIVDELSRSKAITCPPNSVSILPDVSLLRKAIETSPDPRLLLRENLKNLFRAGSSAGIFILFLYYIMYGVSKLMFFLARVPPSQKKMYIPDILSWVLLEKIVIRPMDFPFFGFSFLYVKKSWIKGLVSVPFRRGGAFKRTKC